MSIKLTTSPVTGVLEINVRQAFKAGIKYLTPEPLMSTSGRNQPRTYIMRYLQQTFWTTTTVDHYKEKRDRQDIHPRLFLSGGRWNWKVQTCLRVRLFSPASNRSPWQKTPLYHQLAQRLKRAVVFHVSFENGTPLGPEELSNPWKLERNRY